MGLFSKKTKEGIQTLNAGRADIDGTFTLDRELHLSTESGNINIELHFPSTSTLTDESQSAKRKVSLTVAGSGSIRVSTVACHASLALVHVTMLRNLSIKISTQSGDISASLVPGKWTEIAAAAGGRVTAELFPLQSQTMRELCETRISAPLSGEHARITVLPPLLDPAAALRYFHVVFKGGTAENGKKGVNDHGSGTAELKAVQITVPTNWEGEIHTHCHLTRWQWPGVMENGGAFPHSSGSMVLSTRSSGQSELYVFGKGELDAEFYAKDHGSGYSRGGKADLHEDVPPKYEQVDRKQWTG